MNFTPKVQVDMGSNRLLKHCSSLQICFSLLAGIFLLFFFCLPHYRLVPQFSSFASEEKTLFLALEFVITFTSWLLFLKLGRKECTLFAFFFVLEISSYVYARIPVAFYDYFQIVLTPAVCSLLLVLSAQVGVRRHKILYWLVWIFFGIIVSAQSLNLIYILRYGVVLSKNTIVTVWGSDFAEALAYLQSQWGYWTFIAALLTLAGLFFLLKRASLELEQQKKTGRLFTLLFVFLALVAGYRSKGDYYIDTLPDVISSFLEYRSTISSFQHYRETRQTYAKNIIDVSKKETGEVYVFVIGESVCRDFMGRYGYKWPTTPWLAGAENDNNIIVLENAYSCMCHTEQALSLALTAFNNYCDSDKAKSQMQKALTSDSIIQIFNDAGFETVWLSNQIKMGEWDNVVSSLANDAQHVLFLDNRVGRVASTHRDEELLQPFNEFLTNTSSEKNLAIFLHLKGNHVHYGSSIADSWVWKSDFVDSPAYKPVNRNYDKTIAYTDDLLGRLTELLLHSRFPVSSLFYFSDHGEAVTHGHLHNYDLLEPEMIRIPVFFWFSDSYASRYPETIEMLKNNRERIFTNDLVFDALLDIVHVDYDKTPTSLRITRSDYAINADNARFWNRRLSKEIDPQLLQSGDTK